MAGQLRFPGCELDLGVPDLSITNAANQGVGSLVIGGVTIGGFIPDDWLAVISQAVEHGLDVVNGLHNKLRDNSELVLSAEKSGSKLFDVRVPPSNLPVGNGKRRLGRRLLTVATDCASGKKYTALAMHKAMTQSNINSTFRASGQTGIMIAGEGIPIDAVKADFISGAAELLSPINEPEHWDIIEGQGSLFHPGYSGVSLGLLHGSQPDAFIVCHEAKRKFVSGWEEYELPSIEECIDLHLKVGKLTNPNVACVGVSINTSSLSENERTSHISRIQSETGLPCVDPLVHGCGTILEYMKTIYPF